MRKKVLLRGPVLTRSGYGEHTRLILRTLRAHQDEIDIYLQALNWGQTGWIYEDSEEKRYIDSLLTKTAFFNQNKKSFDASIQVTIPQEWEKVAPVNIGVTAGTETTAVSSKWLEHCNIMDKIIVPSEHTKNSIAGTVYTGAPPNDDVQLICTTPIEVVGYPIKNFDPMDELELDLEYDFNFLTVAQWGPRKNLNATIQWFIEEFIDQEVGLVVKCSMAKNNTMDRLKCEASIQSITSQYKNKKCKVYLLHGDMLDEQVNKLYSNPKIKALVSTSHGEGFGLPLFEAVYNELPVIAPDWGGQLDFLYRPKEDKKGKIKKRPCFAKVDYDISEIQKEAVWEPILIKGSQWCYPKQGSYKMKLREVYKDYDRFKKQAKELNSWVQKEFSQEKIFDKMFKEIFDTIEGSGDDNNEVFVRQAQNG
jgi:glycosyltransferase involved in cell wall biosynthesis